MIKVNPNNGNETKLEFYHRIYSDLTSFIVGRKALKYFYNF